MSAISNDWLEAINSEFHKPYYKELYSFVKEEYSKTVVYPPSEDIFNALHLTPLKDVKVLILGQDPYHGENQAHGLSFSVLPTQKDIPPSLQNIYKELNSDLGCYIPNNGYLEKWAKQGVLLLNTILTVREGEALAHKGKGWEIFTDRVISALSERDDPVIFLLWGNHAQSKAELIDKSRHYIFTAAHPSPLSASRGFFGCRHFSKANETLISLVKSPIDWQIKNI